MKNEKSPRPGRKPISKYVPGIVLLAVIVSAAAVAPAIFSKSTETHLAPSAESAVSQASAAAVSSVPSAIAVQSQTAASAAQSVQVAVSSALSSKSSAQSKASSPAQSQTQTPAANTTSGRVLECNTVTAYLDENGKLTVWGPNDHGQCNVPADLPKIVDVAVGDSHVVALDVNGVMHGWGGQKYGELNFPKGQRGIVAVAAAGCQTTALTADGKVLKWGEASGGSQKDVPADMEKIVQISNGAYITSALSETGKVYSWPTAERVDFPDRVKMVASTDYETAALGYDGKVTANLRHRNLNLMFKQQPELPTDIVKIRGGAANMAAIDSEGKLYIWGEYSYSQYLPSVADVPLNLPPVEDVAFGDGNVICLGRDGKLYAWGRSVSVPDQLNGFAEQAPEFTPRETVPADASAVSSAASEPAADAFADFLTALRGGEKEIRITGDMTVPEGGVTIPADVTVAIQSGVTVRIVSNQFQVFGTLVNNGVLEVAGTIRYYNDTSKLGRCLRQGANARVDRVLNSVTDLAGDVRRYLMPESPYNYLSYVPRTKCVMTVSDVVEIPAGKNVWVNSYVTVHVEEKAILRVMGRFTTYNQPTGDGKIGGNLSVVNINR